MGQLAFGDITNIDIFVILNAMERSLETVEGSADEKEEARTAIQRMREAGAGSPARRPVRCSGPQ